MHPLFFMRGAESMLSEFAERFTGNSDLYQDDYRRPTASINFITAHDGFTLHDLVSYNEKQAQLPGHVAPFTGRTYTDGR